MKDMIILEKDREKNKELIRKNANKITLMEVTRISCPVYLNGRYIEVISKI